MRLFSSRRALWLLFATTWSTLAFAQPATRDHRRVPPPPRQAPVPVIAGPTEAPPSPREEKVAARAGFVWAAGHWDWRANKWDWVAGHWERERAGKSWRAGRWEHQGNRWIFVKGQWVAGTPTPPPTTNPPPPPPTTTPPPVAGPTAPPPPPRQEKFQPRAGFVWIAGQWDWRANKWEWVAGHWERERRGKRWRPSRWEQNDGRWARVDGDWIDDSGPATSPPIVGPTAPPPPPRPEKVATRAGFVWVAGQWDWRANKWDWVAGHWERERAGKRWNPSRWEQRDGRWSRIDGDWVDASAPMPPRDHRGHQRHDWKLERPVVSSYWPTKGKAGSRIMIRGKNFPTTTEVVFAGQPVRGARIKDDQVVFIVPAGATSGAIALRTGGRRALPVGSFEVAADFDPVAEQRRIDQERREAAEAAWKTRQRELAKDRKAREAALRQRMEERQATREQRRAERVAAIQARWAAAFLADADTQSELTLHAQRVAELQRAQEVAEVSANGKLVVRIQMLQSREDQRHDRRMTALQASFNANGGQP